MVLMIASSENDGDKHGSWTRYALDAVYLPLTNVLYNLCNINKNDKRTSILFEFVNSHLFKMPAEEATHQGKLRRVNRWEHEGVLEKLDQRIVTINIFHNPQI